VGYSKEEFMNGIKNEKRRRLVLAIVITVCAVATAYALPAYLANFESTYSTAKGSSIDTCSLCHASLSTYARNPYGLAFAANGRSFPAIESLDSDGDGFTNIQEINAKTFPGDPNSKPALTDTTAPQVTAFAIPPASSSLNVQITSFSATDSVGVTGYLVTESSTPPAAGAAGWSASPQSSFTFTTAGSKTLYGWAKDAAGNVSSSRSATTTITLSIPDTTPPQITAFDILPASSSLNVQITSFSAIDSVGVTGYLVTESSTPPAAGAAGWSASPQSSFTFTTAGSKTLYGWAKDAAGNVSSSRSATTTITLSSPDTTPPQITAFAIPAESNSLTVGITAFVVSDTGGVTGYMLKESPANPSANSSGWVSGIPTSFTFSGSGTRTVYAWAVDAAGNVSNQASATTVIKAPDTGSPVVTTFEVATQISNLTVPIIAFTASDNAGVAGYLVTESSATPAAESPAWSPRPPASYTFSSVGSKTLYAWAKNAAGKISLPKSANVTIVNPPLDLSSMSFWEGKWFRINISHTLGDHSSKIGYWKLRKWDAASKTFLSTLYTFNQDTRLWESLDLQLSVLSGGTLRFLFSFDYNGVFGFTGSLAARTDSRQLSIVSSNIRAFGVYLAKEDSEDDDLDDLVSIRGAHIPESSLPLNIPQ
jgi:hypothetical protein